MLTLRKFLLATFGLLYAISYGFARDQDTSMSRIFEMDIEELMNTKVSIATKSEQPLNETPAIVSVITAEEIRNMGARELEDILQTVPGFELSRNYAGYYGIGVRGVKDSRTTSKILILIDGVPYNQLFFGSTLPWGYDINIDNIERIEIIRGPGSALYGRNAFSAVINIINKSAKSGEKIKAIARYGSFNTKSLSAAGSYSKKKFNTSISARVLKTDITDVKFPNDYGVMSPYNSFRESYSINTNISYGKFTFTGMYLDLSGGATFLNSLVSNKILNYSLTYSTNLSPKAGLDMKFYGHNSKYIEDIEQLPAGFKDTIAGTNGLRYSDVYPLGVYYQPQSKEYTYGLEAELKYKFFANNDLLVGVQGDVHGVKDVIIPTNLNFNTMAPYPGIGRYNTIPYDSGWFVNDKHDYNNIAFLLQDIWYPIKKLGITIGARYDFDSEIGSIINPRMGLVFIPAKNTTIKLLLGKAYRAPSPSEQYVTIGYAVGNKDLEPEKINTFEVSVTNISGKLNQSLNLYLNKLTNMIYAARNYYVDPKNTYYNIGKNTSTGIEYENKIMLSKNFYSYFNYSFTFSENTVFIKTKDSTYTHPDVAPHKINLGANYSFYKHFNINANMFYRSKMERFTLLGSTQEVQNTIGDYVVVNTSFQVKDLYVKGLSFSLSLYNIFDIKYYAQDNQHIKMPPQPGRQVIGSIVYTLK